MYNAGMNTHQIIDRIGGIKEAARALGVDAPAVRVWLRNNQIPSKHWPRINGEYNVPWKWLADPAVVS